MKILKYKKFLETVLSLPLLRSEKNDKPRGEDLIKVLKSDKKVLTLNTGDEITVKNSDDIVKNITDTDGSYDSSNASGFFKKSTRYLPVIKVEKPNDDKVISIELNKIKKDDNFGSGGAGVLTKSYEFIQCIFLAHKLAYPNIPLTKENVVSLLNKYNENELLLKKKFKLFLNNDNSIITSTLIDGLSMDQNWMATFIDVTDDLYKFSSRNRNIFNSRNTYYIFHVSNTDVINPVVYLKSAYKTLLKKDNEKIDFSKYCPADVYVVREDKVIEINNKIKSIIDNSTSDINKLSNYINDIFSKRFMIPISLKKVGAKINNTKTFNIIVNNELERNLPDFDLKGFSISSDVDKGIGSKISTSSVWRDAKGNIIDSKDRKLGIDSSNTSNKLNVDGEIEGTYSRHGKISFNSIFGIINKYRSVSSLQNLIKGEQVLNRYNELEELSIKELRSEIIRLNSILNTLDYKNIINVDHIGGRDISKSGEKQRKNKLISKLQSLQIVYSIAQIYIYDKDIAKEIITKIMRYALSIETSKFVTPRYIRVI